MITTPYDQIAGQFSPLRVYLTPKEQEYLALLLEPLTRESKILDLGCGTGIPIARHLAAQGHRLVGVDGSKAMLAFAQKNLPEHRWIHALMEQVVFDETFDAVVCWDSLFHLPREHYQPVIRKIHRWLRPGGRVMISSGYLVDDNGTGFTDTMFGHEFYYDSLSPHRMAAVMEESGFKVLRAEVCDQPDGDRNKGKWATVAAKNG